VTGPILIHDLVRTARGGRQVLLRTVYACLLVGALFLAFLAWFSPGSILHVLDRGALTLPPGELPRFAESFFSTFMLVQLVAVVLLTPIYTAGALTEEKERRTLDLLLTTSLSDREIVLGKLVARLAPPALLLLTGLPIVALLQFLGGVDPNLLLTGYVVTLWNMIGVGSLSLLMSVVASRTWAAILSSYYCGSAYLALSLSLLVPDWISNRSTGEILASQLLLQAALNLPAAVCCCLAAIWMLRSGQKSIRPRRWSWRKKPPKETWRWERPPVTDDALRWKEQTEHPFLGDERMIDPRGCLWTVGWLVVPSLALWGTLGSNTPGPAGRAVAGFLGLAWSAFLFLLVALNAAGRFSRELEQKTLDSLLTLPDREAILPAKWWASVLHVRHGWWFLGWLMLMGGTCGMNPAVVILIVVSWWVYAAFLASLGVWFSLVLRSTVWARVATLLVALLIIVVGSLLLGGISQGLSPTKAQTLRKITVYSVAPAFTSWIVHLNSRSWDSISVELMAGLPGLGVYGLAAWLLLESASARFRALTGSNR